jgi:CRP-like cAMP-binding protein
MRDESERQAHLRSQGFLSLTKVGEGRSTAAYDKNQAVFAQGDPANAIFYLQNGRVKLTVVSNHDLLESPLKIRHTIFSTRISRAFPA